MPTLAFATIHAHRDRWPAAAKIITLALQSLTRGKPQPGLFCRTPLRHAQAAGRLVQPPEPPAAGRIETEQEHRSAWRKDAHQLLLQSAVRPQHIEQMPGDEQLNAVGLEGQFLCRTADITHQAVLGHKQADGRMVCESTFPWATRRRQRNGNATGYCDAAIAHRGPFLREQIVYFSQLEYVAGEHLHESRVPQV